MVKCLKKMLTFLFIFMECNCNCKAMNYKDVCFWTLYEMILNKDRIVTESIYDSDDDILNACIEIGEFENKFKAESWISKYIQNKWLDTFVENLPVKNICIDNDSNKHIYVEYLIYILISFINSSEIKEFMNSKVMSTHFKIDDNQLIKVSKKNISSAKTKLVQLDFKNIRIIAQIPTEYTKFYLNYNFYIDIQFISDEGTYCLSNLRTRYNNYDSKKYEIIKRKTLLDFNNMIVKVEGERINKVKEFSAFHLTEKNSRI